MLSDLIEQKNYEEAIQYIYNLPDRGEKIYKISLIYRLQSLFVHEKKIINIALSNGIKPEYFESRKAWHDLPLLDKDPCISKLTPRPTIPVHRDQPIDMNFCFVSASGSDEPYFSLSIELLESIQSTSYKHIPFKLIDCGLNNEDRDYLIKRFGVEIKDPGWDVDLSIMKGKRSASHTNWNDNGWKGLTARPYLYKHFPGYDYYFWIDTDTWLQDESAIDDYLLLANSQGISLPQDSQNSLYGKTAMYEDTIPKHFIKEMLGKQPMFDGIFCASAEFLKDYSQLSQDILKEVGVYKFGQDYTIMNFLFYHMHKKHLEKDHYFSLNTKDYSINLFIEDHKLYDQGNSLIGFVSLNGGTKKYILKSLRHKNNPTKTSIQSVRYRSFPADEELVKKLLLEDSL